MTQADSDGLPTMGEQAEAALESQFRCTCGHPEAPGVLHKTDAPCVQVDKPVIGWLERLKQEHHDLDQKGMALSFFIRNNPEFLKLAERDQYLLEVQQRSMADYYTILTERIFRAEHPDMAKKADAAALAERQQANLEALDKGSMQ